MRFESVAAVRLPRVRRVTCGRSSGGFDLGNKMSFRREIEIVRYFERENDNGISLRCNGVVCRFARGS